MMAVGSYTKDTGTYRMYAPDSYDAFLYIGYTFEQMKRAYRKQFGLERKHIDWIITGRN